MPTISTPRVAVGRSVCRSSRHRVSQNQGGSPIDRGCRVGRTVGYGAHDAATVQTKSDRDSDGPTSRTRRPPASPTTRSRAGSGGRRRRRGRRDTSLDDDFEQIVSDAMLTMAMAVGGTGQTITLAASVGRGGKNRRARRRVGLRAAARLGFIPGRQVADLEDAIERYQREVVGMRQPGRPDRPRRQDDRRAAQAKRAPEPEPEAAARRRRPGAEQAPSGRAAGGRRDDSSAWSSQPEGRGRGRGARRVRGDETRQVRERQRGDRRGPRPSSTASTRCARRSRRSTRRCNRTSTAR